MKMNPFPDPTRHPFVLRAVCLLVILLFARPAAAQVFTPLVQFTNVWKYDRSGLELGTAWRTNDFDDSAWSSGPGLLGYDDVLTPYLATVPSGLGTSFGFPLSQTVTTYYFRTTFEYNGPTQALRLMATNLVDDGCAIWLNGRLAGGVRMPGNFNATTVFFGPAVEGQLDVVSLTNFLRQGVNQLAVEVHQSTFSSDVMYGMKLVAILQTPLAITNQPQDATAIVGESVTLSVGVSGGPVAYRWQKDGINIVNATNSTYSIVNIPLTAAGDFRVICSNSVNVVTSDVARLVVFTDLVGPSVRSATDDESFGLGRIVVRFSELLEVQSARRTNNYRITRVANGATVPVTNVNYAASVGSLLHLDTSSPGWVPGEEYLLEINDVVDRYGNAIAPGTTIRVSRPQPLIRLSSLWSSHARYFLDPTIYEQAWNRTDFVESSQFWVSGFVPFCGGAIGNPPCAADCETPIDYQLSPTLFRSTFQWPADNGSNAVLYLNGGVDDGVLLYLNGTEIWRTNVAGISPAVSVTNTSIFRTPDALCITGRQITVSNLLSGTNVLAAAVVQSGGVAETDTAFSLTVRALVLNGPIVPSGPPPALAITRLDIGKARLSWEGGGYLLEGTTNLSEGNLSYPFGPWIQVTNMANPYTNSPGGGFRFFRLKTP